MTMPFTTTLEKLFNTSDRQLVGHLIVEAYTHSQDRDSTVYLELSDEQTISLPFQQTVTVNAGKAEVIDLDGNKHAMLFEVFSKVDESMLLGTSTPESNDSGELAQGPALEIQKTLVVSTGHLPDAERMMLDGALSARMDRSEKANDFPVVDPVGNYGWRVCVDSDWPVQSEAPALYKGLELARANDCQWLQYDRDADQIEQLPYFED